MISKRIIEGISYSRIEGTGTKNNILIFIPGIGTYRANYVSHLRSFIEYYSFIYILDLPEQGSKGSWRIGDMVDNLKEFIKEIDSTEITNIDLGGHSAGALAIISFLMNYNSKVEDFLIKENENKNKFNEKLFEAGFTESFPESRKVNLVLMYCPPHSFNAVFPRSFSIVLKNKKASYIKNILDVVVNVPMRIIHWFQRNNDFKFSLEGSDLPYYYNLKLTDHQRFFDYVSKYETFFELYQKLNASNEKRVAEIISGKRIFIQTGGLDWLINSYRMNENLRSEFCKCQSEIKFKKHKLLGHLLRKKLRFDINLNNQMVTNKEVLSESKHFIEKNYGN